MTPSRDGQRFALHVRIPGWCVGRPVPSDLYEQVVPGTLADFSVAVNGAAVKAEPRKGYCVIAARQRDVSELYENPTFEKTDFKYVTPEIIDNFITVTSQLVPIEFKDSGIFD